MRQRVKYIQHSENVLKSKYIYTNARGTLYRVFLYLDTLKYRIYNVKRQTYPYEGTSTTNIRAVKRMVKRKLLELGVDFELELRGL